MTLDPKTTEVWAGVRLLSSMVSELQAKVDDLRANLSGFQGYREFVRSQSSFDDLESNLQKRAGDLSAISDSDVTDTVDLLRDNFADWDSYKGDPSSDTGVYSNSTYDDYRTYLTDNGIGTVDADEHIQLLKDLFDADAQFSEDTGTHTDWDTFQTELENNGVSSSSASTTVDNLKTVFSSVNAMDRQVIGSASWSEFETYLTNNGLSSSEASSAVSDLKTAYGSTLNSTVRDNFSEWDSYSELKTYLENQGLSSADAQTYIDKLKNIYNSFDDFRQTTLSQDDANEDTLNQSNHSESSSDSNLGVHIFEKDDVDEDGTSMTSGDVSLRFDGQFNMVDVGSSDLGEEASRSDISWSNLSVSNLNPFPGQSFTVSATASNSISFQNIVQARLIIDNEVIESDVVTVPGNGSRTIRFSTSLNRTGTYDVQINDTDTASVVVNETSGL